MISPFSLWSCDGDARRGAFRTKSHGSFQTPAFMPVGTKATVKGVDHERLKEAGAEVTLVNTYHLHLRPGSQLVKELGGIHDFTGWSGPILSDSGGYQVFSLKSIRQISEDGVRFRSHIDGAEIMLTPERSVAIQEELGVDIAMSFDECPSSDLDYDGVARSLERTIRWEKRCSESRQREETALFGITQGGKFRDLRTASIEALKEIGFDGYAVGGLSVGEPQEVMYDVLSYHVNQFPSESIRYLMGVGTPEDIVEAVSQGVDLFDCVMPTRSGRFGRAFTNGDVPFINIKNAQWSRHKDPLDANCPCIACRRYSRAYIHHLFRCDEMLGPQLISIHNLTHYLSLMEKIRFSIETNSFQKLYNEVRGRWSVRRSLSL